MSTPKVDAYAFRHDISNKEAKRRLRSKNQMEDTIARDLPKRGVPVAGTGVPKGT